MHVCFFHRLFIRSLSKTQKDYCTVFVGVLLCLYVRDIHAHYKHTNWSNFNLSPLPPPSECAARNQTKKGAACFSNLCFHSNDNTALLHAWHHTNGTSPVCVCMCSWWVFVTILFMLILCTLIHVCKCFASWMAVFFGEWLLLNGFYELACWVKCVYMCETDIVTMWVNKFNFKFYSILLLVC